MSIPFTKTSTNQHFAAKRCLFRQKVQISTNTRVFIFWNSEVLDTIKHDQDQHGLNKKLQCVLNRVFDCFVRLRICHAVKAYIQNVFFFIIPIPSNSFMNNLINYWHIMWVYGKSTQNLTDLIILLFNKLKEKHDR